MEKRRLGPSGLEVSAVGLGCNNFGTPLDLEGTRAVIDRAIERGVTLFDTADVYGEGHSESFIGEVLGARRKDIVLATKFGLIRGGEPRADRAYILESVDKSLRKLKTDWIDLYQAHRYDPKTPIEETLETLNELIKAGKVREIGCSNYTAEQVRDADDKARAMGLKGFVSCQDEYSLLHRGIELGVLPAMLERGLGLLPYFPLASGLLTGKYRKGQAVVTGRLKSGRFAGVRTEENLDLVERLMAFAEAHGRSLLDLAFGWLLAKPGLSSVIAGATTPAQIDANVAAGWRLSEQELAEVTAILGPAKPGGVFS